MGFHKLNGVLEGLRNLTIASVLCSLELLLVVIISLLFAKKCHRVINHDNDLVNVDLLSTQGKANQAVDEREPLCNGGLKVHIQN